MRIANLSGRLVLITADKAAADADQAREGRFGPAPQTGYAGGDGVPGLPGGQHLSGRAGRLVGPSPQFSLAKSLPGLGPMGPWLVSPDDLGDRDDLELACSINGEQMQKGRTRNLVFSVPAMVSALSRQLPLLPGDVLFTGTPAGVGIGRDPQRWLAPGDELVSYISGIGELRQRFVGADTTS